MSKEKVEAFDGVADNDGEDLDEVVDQDNQHSRVPPESSGKVDKTGGQPPNVQARDITGAEQEEFKPSEGEPLESGSGGEFRPSSNEDRDAPSDHGRIEGAEEENDEAGSNWQYPPEGDSQQRTNGHRGNNEDQNENEGHEADA